MGVPGSWVSCWDWVELSKDCFPIFMVWFGSWSAGNTAGAVVGVDEAGHVDAGGGGGGTLGLGGGVLRKKLMLGKDVLEFSSTVWGHLQFGLFDPL